MLQAETRGSVRFLTLDRPEVRNAFNDELIALLSKSVRQAEDDGIRVAVIKGNGKAFCAGGDLNWMKKAAGYSEEENRQDALKLAKLMKAIAESPVLFITQVHGACFGGGCGLVAAGDVCLAAEGTLFAFSEVKLGLVPATISTFVLPKIGGGHARALFTTGEVFDADRAMRIGLANDVVPSEQLEARVSRSIEAALAAGPSALAYCKALAQSAPPTPEEGAAMLARFRASEEGREGVTAFLDKRPASFVQEWEA